MAKFDYRCPEEPCDGLTIEVEHKMSDHPNVLCPRCGDSMVKVFSPTAVVFKGSGWYTTDSRKINCQADVL